MADKVYYPETIEANLLPVEEEVTFVGESQPSSLAKQNGDKTYSPQVYKGDLPPAKIIPADVIGMAFNTQSKKILGNFTFGALGAIQVGTYESGVSGDIKISPSGILARNDAGATTFSLDGDTGDASFLGTITAGSVISAEMSANLITAGKLESSDGNTFFDLDNNLIQIQDENDVTILDAKGLVSSANFTSDSVENATGRTYSNSATYEDIANTSITTVSLVRATEVLIIYTVNVIEFPLNGNTTFAGKVTLRIDSTDQTNNNFELQLTSQSPIADTSPWGGPLTASGIVTLATGTHTLKLRAQTINTNSQLNVETTSLAYIVLGA